LNPDLLSANASGSYQVSCFDAADGSLTVSANGGTGAYSYSNDNGTTQQPGNSFNNVPAGNYTVVVTDANGCTATATGTITINPLPNTSPIFHD